MMLANVFLLLTRSLASAHRIEMCIRDREKVILKRKKENQKGNDCKECYQAEGIYFTRYFRIDWNQTKLPVAQIHLWTGGEENE